ncbi:MAG TPA: hypothetical protein VFZ78_06965 [Flavisolibacter sp.]
MKKIMLFILALCLYTVSDAQSASDCSQLKNGTFKTVSEGGTTLITRKGSLQTEVNDEVQFRGEFKIVWTDDCTYTIQPKKIYSKGNLLEIDYEEILTVKILEITKSYYLMKATSNKREGVVEGKVYFVK